VLKVTPAPQVLPYFFDGFGFLYQSKLISQVLKPYRFPIAIVVAGALLRCIWPADMEWKFDEQEMFRLAGEAWKNGLPLIGMPSGAGLPNAGFSIWPFALLYGLHPSPLFMAMGVQWLNVLALALMVHCALRYEEPVKTKLLWGLAMYAVSLMPVLFARKIWAQDLMPVFIAVMWWGYLHRNSWSALLVTGVFCAFAGQLHLSGFFYAGGFLLAILFFKKFSKKQWLWLFAGAIPATLPGIPWVLAMLSCGGGISHINNILKLEYWLRLLTDTPGFNMYYFADGEWKTFMAFPGGMYLPLIHASGIAGLVLFGMFKTIKTGFSEIMPSHPIGFLLFAFVIIPGLLITFSGIPVRSHYMIGALPMASITLSVIVSITYKYGNQLIVILQVLFTVFFLLFIHQSNTLRGDYGTPYRKQLTQTSENHPNSRPLQDPD